MIKKPLSVAVPWSLSHYLVPNGFHPLYHAWFGHVPAGIVLNAWDNARLCEKLASDVSVRSRLLNAVKALKDEKPYRSGNRIEKEYQDHFWPPNQVLTAQLPGEIELYHTAPFPSLTRPFVLHCESFAPIFCPFAHQGTGPFADHDRIREYYRKILAHPLCLGIFSHLPETLESIRKFFGDVEIDKKLLPSAIGLSERAFGGKDIEMQGDLSTAKFLFVNSAHQNPAGFFKRGGHIVLRFWERYRHANRRGLLVMRCRRPSGAELKAHGVNTAFVSSETGASIVWIEDYLISHELSALLGEMHFFLLPSDSLHSVSIMVAMANGVIPVVTDTLGTSRYVADAENGIVLKGIREVLWRLDPAMGVLVDQYREKPETDKRLVEQLWSRVTALLDDPAAYWEMRNKTFHHARVNFSGEAFSAGFWQKVVELYEGWDPGSIEIGNRSRAIGEQLQDTLIEAHDWDRIFESPTQPMKRMYTGSSVIWEWGGAFLAAIDDNPRMRGMTDWSVVARYFDKNAPELAFSSSLADFGGRFLSLSRLSSDGGGAHVYAMTLIYAMVNYAYAMAKRISRLLVAFPVIHRFAVRVLRRAQRYWRVFRLYRRYRRFRRSGMMTEPDMELVVEEEGFSVVRFFHRYYAFPRHLDTFDVIYATEGGYRSLIQGLSLQDVMAAIEDISSNHGSHASPDSGPGQHVPTRSSESPDDELERLQLRVIELEGRIQTLEARLAKDSHSPDSKPLSSTWCAASRRRAHSANQLDATSACQTLARSLWLFPLRSS